MYGGDKMQEILCFIGITFLFVILVIGFIEGLNSDSIKIKVLTIIGYLIVAIVCLILAFNI